MSPAVLNEFFQWVLLVFVAVLLIRIVMWIGVCAPCDLDERVSDLEDRMKPDGK